jgi:hypothetical protein
MSRPPSSGRVNLRQLFLHMQTQMLAHLSAGELFEQPTACGAVTEQHWLDLFARYLPERYRASSAFVVDSDGRRSRQIDIAIYDRFYSPLLLPHPSGLHIPAESVYAVFEVKQDLNSRLIHDAARKAASVRALRRTSVPVPGARSRAKKLHPILAGILALRATWHRRFNLRLPAILRRLPPDQRLDLGCALQQGAFEVLPSDIRLSTPEESLIFFILRLLHRLRALGTAPAPDLMQYGASLTSFSRAKRGQAPIA